MFKMLIQVAAGGCDRQIYNERTLELLETRRGAIPYPYAYGFIIGTSAEDGACVDCYLVTRDALPAGSIVECQPLALLLQDEDGEMDHKVLAGLPGQPVDVGDDLLREMQAFIHANFASHPELKIVVGPILPRTAALEHLRQHGGG